MRKLLFVLVLILSACSIMEENSEKYCWKLEDKNLPEYATYELIEVPKDYNLEDATYCTHQRKVKDSENIDIKHVLYLDFSNINTYSETTLVPIVYEIQNSNSNEALSSEVIDEFKVQLHELEIASLKLSYHDEYINTYKVSNEADFNAVVAKQNVPFIDENTTYFMFDRMTNVSYDVYKVEDNTAILLEENLRDLDGIALPFTNGTYVYRIRYDGTEMATKLVYRDSEYQESWLPLTLLSPVVDTQEKIELEEYSFNHFNLFKQIGYLPYTETPIEGDYFNDFKYTLRINEQVSIEAEFKNGNEIHVDGKVYYVIGSSQLREDSILRIPLNTLGKILNNEVSNIEIINERAYEGVTSKLTFKTKEAQKEFIELLSSLEGYNAAPTVMGTGGEGPVVTLSYADGSTLNLSNNAGTLCIYNDESKIYFNSNTTLIDVIDEYLGIPYRLYEDNGLLMYIQSYEDDRVLVEPIKSDWFVYTNELALDDYTKYLVTHGFTIYYNGVEVDTLPSQKNQQIDIIVVKDNVQYIYKYYVS